MLGVFDSLDNKISLDHDRTGIKKKKICLVASSGKSRKYTDLSISTATVVIIHSGKCTDKGNDINFKFTCTV